MVTVFGVLIFVGILFAFAFFRASRWIWMSGTVATLLALSIWTPMNIFVLGLLWLLLIPGIGLMLYLPYRLRFVSAPLFAYLKEVLPQMSKTEEEALLAGDVGWEGKLFRGAPPWRSLHEIEQPTLSKEEKAFIKETVNPLCAHLSEWELSVEKKEIPAALWDEIKATGLLGMIIPKKYGGLEFSAVAHSTIVSQIASRSISAAVSIMVPNSLGPAELLTYYGTDAQKNYYLPRLAKGEEIPCFALTGTHSGSDAAAMHDVGIVTKGKFEGKEIIGISLTWDKRYITLAPIATLLGLAFKLADPDHLLGEKEDLGITLCLIPTSHKGVEVGEKHSPLNLAFSNGPTRGENVFIPMDWIIGGPERIGQGWRMLMECLSIGRAISLPALSAAVGKLAFRSTGAYAALREQFGIAIGQFEGVQEALARIGGMTYLVESSRLMTAHMVDRGRKPSLASAIAKYHMTEMSRQMMNDAMDVHAGRGIQLGPRNYLGLGYLAIPISITVEGANILTRNLIIFGQGALRCHPYLRKEMEAIHNGNRKMFDKLLWSHIGFTLRNGIRTIVGTLSHGFAFPSPFGDETAYYYRQLTRMSGALAFVADITLMVLGGKLKRKENLSARLGDVLSYLYLASCVLKFYRDEGALPEDKPFVKWSLTFCLFKIQAAFEGFFQNFTPRWLGGLLKTMIFPIGRPYKSPSDKDSHRVAVAMQKPSKMRDRLTKNCYVGEKETDPLMIIEAAFAKKMEILPLEDKYRKALADKKIVKVGSKMKTMEAAYQQGIFTDAEWHQLKAYWKLQHNAMAVDVFTDEQKSSLDDDLTEKKVAEG